METGTKTQVWGHVWGKGGADCRFEVGHGLYNDRGKSISVPKLEEVS